MTSIDRAIALVAADLSHELFDILQECFWLLQPAKVPSL
jgi:hypothetical protein